MGNQIAQLAAKHEPHVPELDDKLAIPYALPTGAVFLPMSPLTGDLPIYSVPQIILNSGMDRKEYQDCIYSINDISIHRYSNVRKVIRRLANNLAPIDLYYEFLECFIMDIEEICFELNLTVLKNYDLVFIPFVNILRDETNSQHFGIIIDMLNRKKYDKKVTKIAKSATKNIKKSQKNAKKLSKSQKNIKNKRKTSSKKPAKNANNSSKKKNLSKVFCCFKLAQHHRNRNNSDDDSNHKSSYDSDQSDASVTGSSVPTTPPSVGANIIASPETLATTTASEMVSKIIINSVNNNNNNNNSNVAKGGQIMTRPQLTPVATSTNDTETCNDPRIPDIINISAEDAKHLALVPAAGGQGGEEENKHAEEEEDVSLNMIKFCPRLLSTGSVDSIENNYNNYNTAINVIDAINTVNAVIAVNTVNNTGHAGTPLAVETPNLADDAWEESRMRSKSYIESNGPKFGLQVYLPKNLRSDPVA